MPFVPGTFSQPQRYPQAEIARLFRQRWHVELDLRNIKVSLQMDDLRTKTPDMVCREILVHWLAYNLIRKVMAQAALSQERLPRKLSFAGALAAIAGAWDHATLARQERLTALAQTQGPDPKPCPGIVLPVLASAPSVSC